ncbi:SAM-dependent methyltransferase, BioC-like [hydrothermal vent metagenome]|uniref:SAM-dependent methyltransferase, BioC-like n=1 Tax=hydrothermal vent metagenome TaxID=652676 RepID=A0A3B0R058_9ZZZZ
MPHSNKIFANKVFDRQLVAKRRVQALARENYPDFLDELIGQELVSRLDLIERQFENCVILGQPANRFLQEIRRSPKLHNIIAQRSGPGGRSELVYDSEWLPFKDNSLDCIIAPPGLELVNDLPGTLIQINRALKPDGLFLGAMYGGLTLVELRHAWLLADEETSGGASPRVAPFIDVRQAGNLLQRAGLALPVADADVLTIRYDNVKALMTEIKNMGFANGLVQRSGKFISRGLLELVDFHYRKEFSDPDGRIRATLEINYLTAWCPHDSQQKPLKPGSARQHFSDVLSGTQEN